MRHDTRQQSLVFQRRSRINLATIANVVTLVAFGLALLELLFK